MLVESLVAAARRSFPSLLIFATFVGLSVERACGDGDRPDAKTRTFRFDYGATVTGLPPGKRVRVWLPVPPSNEHQAIRQLRRQLPAAAENVRLQTEPEHGNEILSFELTAPAGGRFDVDLSYRVERGEVRGMNIVGRDAGGEHELSLEDRRRYLAPDRLVPTDGRPLELLRGIHLPGDPLALGKQLYERVDDHMRYDKSRPGYGNGDSVWACDSRFGNCTDFHSLFISLARGRGLPARFEIGFPIPEQRGKGQIGGYHCWAYFYVVGRGWVPVDISEADKRPELKGYYFGNLSADRVAFTRGRDIQLVPAQAGEPLNYFVYPYVEVDGKAWPGDEIELRLRYQDLP